MYTTFEEISSKARVWIYQSGRPLTLEEEEKIEALGKKFTDGWEAHGKALQASIKVFHSHFIVIAADESFNMTTGCSIDSSVGFIRNIAADLHLDLFDKTQIAFLRDNEVYLAPLKNLKSQVADGIITEETLAFNNLVSDKSSMEEQWLTPAKNTWLSRYF